MKAGAQRAAANSAWPCSRPTPARVARAWLARTTIGNSASGAGFYLDATQSPWSGHWCMESYLIKELLAGRRERVRARSKTASACSATRWEATARSRWRCAILATSPVCRHSRPICAPSRCPWGHKAFTGYLGQDESSWAAHDASVLMAQQASAPYPGGILIDQGLDDKFLAEQLHPEAFEAACAKAGQPLTLRRHAGFDHSYYFIASFVDDHLRHHAQALSG